MKKLLTLFFLIFISTVLNILYAQNEAYESDIIKKKNIAYYEGKPFTGWLISDQSGINNKCDCTLKAKYVDGKIHGVKQQWYTSGVLKYSGQFYKGYKSGTHKYYFSNGNLEKKIVYKKGGVRHEIVYKKNGSKRKYQKYVKGKLVLSKKCTSDMGDCISMFSDDELITTKDEVVDEDEVVDNTTILMVNDTIEVDPPKLFNGLQKVLFTNNTPHRIIQYENAFIVKDTIFSINQKRQLIKQFDKGELIHQENYNENGNLLKINNYQNSAKHGEQIYYDEDGNLERKELFEYGNLIKVTRFYKNTNNIKSIELYANNKKHGKQEKFDENGQQTFIQNYDNGKLISESQYRDNRLFKTFFYDNNGHVKENRLFYENEVLKEKVIFDDDQNIIEKTQFSIENLPVKSVSNDIPKKISVEILYDKVGNKASEKAYKNKKLIYEGKYLNGQKNGIWKYYFIDKHYEVMKYYEFDKLISEEYTFYDRQIKNIDTKNTRIIKYTSKIINDKPKYFLLKYMFSDKYEKEEDINKRIIDKFNSFFSKSNISIVTDTKSIKNKMVDGVIEFDNIRYRFYRKSKKENNNKFKFLLNFTIKFYEYDKMDHVRNEIKEFTFPKRLTDLSFYKKEKTLMKVFELVDVNIFVQKVCFPRKASFLRIIEQTEHEIDFVLSSFGKGFVEYNEYFYIKDEHDLNSFSKIRVTKVFSNQTILIVVEGKEWLAQYLKTHKYPIITEKTPAP